MSDENILRDDIYEIEVGGQTFLSIFGKHIIPINRIKKIDLHATNGSSTNCLMIEMLEDEAARYHAVDPESYKYYFNYYDADALRHFFKERKK